jgi:DNA repair exonuclease SbcCD ATPase subunit
MKAFTILVGLFLTLLAALSLNAQKLYTWTDENGVVHLADQPPPEIDRAENVEVFKYEEKTPQEIEAIQHKKENLRRKFDREEQIEKAHQAEIRAREAEERAQKTVQQAQEEYEYNNEYIRRLTSTKNKRKKFRKRVDRLKAETEASRAEAKAAVEQAEEAAIEARTAAEEAQKYP